MYLRVAHVEHSIPALRAFINANPLGILTTAITSPLYPLLQSSHIPWLLDVADPTSETELGQLRGHLARANPHAKAMIDALTLGGDNRDAGGPAAAQLRDEVMVLFNGPVDHYVTPKFYTATKPVTGKVVPTWNYAAAQAYGRATVYFDAKAADTVAFLTRQISDLSRHAETSIMGYSDSGKDGPPWSVAEAPERYIKMMMKAIIGISIEVTSLEGKFKMSQELAAGDREGVVEGFKRLGTETGDAIAESVKVRAEIKADVVAVAEAALKAAMASPP